MTTPDERKTMQVSPGVHEAVHALGTQMGLSADGVLRYLLDEYTLRVHVQPAQQRRWKAAADEAGIPLSDWVSFRIEASLQFPQGPSPDRDRETLNQIFYRVNMLCDAAGLKPTAPQPARRAPRKPLLPPPPGHHRARPEGDD